MCVDDENQIIVKAVDCCTAKLYTDRERETERLYHQKSNYKVGPALENIGPSLAFAWLLVDLILL